MSRTTWDPMCSAGEMELDVVEPRISAIVVNYDGGADLRECLVSLIAQGPGVEVVVVDNASRDGSADAIESAFPAVRVLRSTVNRGFAGGANHGAAASRGAALVFLNPDVRIEERCLAALADELAANPGVCGPLILSESSGELERGWSIDLLGDPVALSRGSRPPLYVPGCALATDRGTFEAVGGFDERFFMIAEDTDYCWRVLLRGGAVSVVSRARATHRGGGSTPGGYVRGGRIEVTTFRIALRERNTLATALKCGPIEWVAPVVLLRLMRILAIAAVYAGFGRADVAAGLAKGVAWNVRSAGRTLSMRRELRGSRRDRRRILRERAVRRISWIQLVAQHGLPRFVDRGAGQGWRQSG